MQRDERPSEIEVSAAWRHAAEAILAGIRHDLNGRLGTVSGLVQLARLDGCLDDETGDTLESELARMEHLSRLIEAAFLDRHHEPEPIVLSELVALAAELLRRHRGLESATVELDAGDVVPVIAPRTPLLRALIVLLASAARRHPRVRLTLQHDGGYAALRIGPIRAGDVQGEAAVTLTDAVEAARGVAERLGGTLTVEPGEGLQAVGAAPHDFVVLRVPTLEAQERVQVGG